MTKFVLWGTYCNDALEKRAPFRDEHLSRLASLKQQGILVTLGPTKCNSYVFGIFQASNEDVVRKLVEEDIYWKEQIWTSIQVYPWVQAF